MKVGYITNTDELSGVGVRSVAIKSFWPQHSSYELNEYYLDGVGRKIVIKGKSQLSVTKWPGVMGSKSISWIRLGRKLSAKGVLDQGIGLYHLTNQTLSFLAKDLRPSVVTVHDVIEMTDPQDSRAGLVNRYLYGGIRRAEQIICVSNFTADAVRDLYGIANDKMTVAYNGVKPVFQAIENFSTSMAAVVLRHRWRIPPGAKIVLYVGSEHPRKNVSGVLQVIAGIKKAGVEVIFLKVGSAGLPKGRRTTLEVADRLGIRDIMRIVESVTDEELSDLYNLADVLVYPSLYEGFGLPPLEAMAAGAPVVCSNSTSLPEVVGNDEQYGECAGLLYDPLDTSGMTEGALRIFQDEKLRDDLIKRGKRRAARFNWAEAASKVAGVYDKLSNVGTSNE